MARLANLQYTYGLCLDMPNQAGYRFPYDDENEEENEYGKFHYYDYLRNESYRNDPSSISLCNELNLTERNGY